ncbi:histidine phosphatase superfamily [Podospora didyma]|uniref:Histidine phosphatase superfamily n=1 Tax=Podospora didyma TaxID=330526 RepID=A0AAE0NU83_9PEZI|nr:histidine phosphatase superfamily [Podospora didyma]
MMVHEQKFTFTAVTGYFKHDAQPTTSFNAITLPGLGLIDRVYETDATFDPRREKQHWERFAHYLDHLNSSSGDNVAYKLIYAARHGEGFHNVMETKVETVAWESYWAKLDGDSTVVWADAHLTPTGVGQAQAMQVFWRDSASALKLPLSRRHYASPLTRCLQTCDMAFSGLTLPSGEEAPAFKPIIKELVRERLGIHTCDRRSTRTYIQEHFPRFAFEDGFSEQDELWSPDVRETLEEHAVRVESFLNELFMNDTEPIISLTAHSGTILALYEATGHPAVHVAPGAIVPILIRAEKVV